MKNEPALSTWLRTASMAKRHLKKAFQREHIYIAAYEPTSTVPFAFMTKAFQVHDAIVTLCKASFGSEALALSRILLEMHFSLRWMTNQDQQMRTEAFAFFGAKRKQYSAKTFAKYNPDSPRAAEALSFVKTYYEKYADNYDSYISWSGHKLKYLAEETEVLYRGMCEFPNALRDYETLYSMASDHVHVTAVALNALFPPEGTPYEALRANEPRLAQQAIVYGTLWLFEIVRRVNAYRTLELEAQISAAYKPFTNLLDSEGVR
jgi:Family of unknown function (DUF5677)